MRKSGWILASLLLCFCAGSCAASKKDLKMYVTVDRDANEDSPASISVVVVYDKMLLPELSAMTAAQWFKQREQYVREHQRALYEELWEFVPGQHLAPIVRKVASSKADAFIFARYHASGPFRFRFDPKADVRVSLGRNRVAVTGVTPKEEEKQGDVTADKSLSEKLLDKAEDVADSTGKSPL